MAELILKAWISILANLVLPISIRFHYLTQYKKNVEMSKKQIQNLRDKRDEVQRAVDASTRNGAEIKVDVQRWLTDVEHILAESEKIVANKRFLNGPHLNLSMRYKLSKEAIRFSYAAMRFQGRGTAENIPPPGVEVMPAFLPASVDSMSVSLSAPPTGIEFISTQDFVAFQSTKLTLDQIFEALRDDNCHMVGLYGMGGVGKTSLAKEIVKKVKEQKLFDQVVMAVVSQNPDITKIQGQLADMLGLKFSEESESGRAGRLRERLKNEKRVLIILDDVGTRLDLKAVGIPHGAEHKGCKIILTTRRENVCTAMGINTKKIRVDVLSNEESWDLFRRNVGVDIESNPLKVPAKAIVGECKGLPIALVTLGRALRDQDLEQWNAAAHQLNKSKDTNIIGLDQDGFSCIRLMYDYLPDEETKLCLLFCCLFPEDYDIEIECLARYAKGIGLIEGVDTMVEARSRINSIIKNLKASSMLLDSKKEGCVKMHDIVRNAAISIASRANHDLFLVEAGAGLKEWPEQEMFESYTGISLMMNDLQELPHGLNYPNLKILLLGENGGLTAIPEAFFKGMGMLKVLDLSEMNLSLPPSLKFLRNLRTLHLDRCKLGNISIVHVLKELEILSFCASDIRELPEEIRELINLRVLDLTHCRFLERIPSNVISELIGLEELYMGNSFHGWQVEGTREERSSPSLSELKLLPCLTILCVDVNKVACFPDNFFLPNLLKLHVTVGASSDGNYYPNSRSLTLQRIDAPFTDTAKTLLLKMVEELTLFDRNGRYVNILLGIAEGELNGLKSLELFHCDWTESLIKPNQLKPVTLLPNLERLLLSNLKNMEVMCHGLIPNGSLEKLRVLQIYDCQEFKVILPANLFQRLIFLEEVTVMRCEKLEVIFQLVNEEVVAEEEDANMVLSSLRKLKLLDMPELFSIWNGPGFFVSLCNLTVLDIAYCKKLRNIFSLSLAQSLSNLETLKINMCKNLETIVAEDQEGTVVSNNNCIIQPVIFPKLKFIEVAYCSRLTSIFTIATARGLEKLKEVRLRWNQQLMEIVCRGRERAEESDEKEILLPQLHLLQLRDMRKLERLCPGSFHMHLPSLKELVVEGCPLQCGVLSEDWRGFIQGL